MPPDDLVIKAAERLDCYASFNFTLPNQAVPPKLLPCFTAAPGSIVYNNPFPPALIFSCLPLRVTAPAGLVLQSLNVDADSQAFEVGGKDGIGEPLRAPGTLATARVAVFARSADALQGLVWGNQPQPPYLFAGGFADTGWLTTADVWLWNQGTIRAGRNLIVQEQLSLALGPCTQPAAQALATTVPGITVAADTSVDLRGRPDGIAASTLGVTFEIGGTSSFDLGHDGVELAMIFHIGVLADVDVDVRDGVVTIPHIDDVGGLAAAPAGALAFDANTLYLCDSAGDIQEFELT
jgi:hypothetical protein